MKLKFQSDDFGAPESSKISIINNDGTETELTFVQGVHFSCSVDRVSPKIFLDILADQMEFTIDTKELVLCDKETGEKFYVYRVEKDEQPVQ